MHQLVNQQLALANFLLIKFGWWSDELKNLIYLFVVLQFLFNLITHQSAEYILIYFFGFKWKTVHCWEQLHCLNENDLINCYFFLLDLKLPVLKWLKRFFCRL